MEESGKSDDMLLADHLPYTDGQHLPSELIIPEMLLCWKGHLLCECPAMRDEGLLNKTKEFSFREEMERARWL